MDYDKDSDVLIAIRDIINDYLYKERRKQRDKDKKYLANLADMLLVAAREREKIALLHVAIASMQIIVISHMRKTTYAWRCIWLR